VQTTATRSIGGRLVVVMTALVSLPAPLLGQQPRDLPIVRFEAVYGGQTPASPYPVARLDDGEQGADLDQARAGSLAIAQPLPIRDVLLLLFRGTGFSIVFDPAVTGTFTGELSDLSLRQALEAVLVPAGLDYRRQARVIQVFPPRAETRLFEVGHLAVRRTWQRRTTGGERRDQGVAADLTATVESDFFGELTAGVQSLLSPGGRAHVDRKAGVVQVTDFADRLQQVGIYIETVVLRATRQVQIVSRVLEVTLADQPAIDWTAVARAAGIIPRPGGGIEATDVEALIGAIGAFGAVRTLAAPRLLAMNNEPAVMRIVSSGAGLPADDDRRGSAAAESGLTISITSQISADGIVQMSVSPTLATAGRAGASLSGSVVEVDTVVRVRGGETVVIAGLVREATEAVAAGGLPGILGVKNRRTSRTELVVLLTPTVVNAGPLPVAGAQ
jgi:type II secretory pathway component GspD/PulD (secretin)